MVILCVFPIDGRARVSIELTSMLLLEFEGAQLDQHAAIRVRGCAGPKRYNFIDLRLVC